MFTVFSSAVLETENDANEVRRSSVAGLCLRKTIVQFNEMRFDQVSSYVMKYILNFSFSDDLIVLLQFSKLNADCRIFGAANHLFATTNHIWHRTGRHHFAV